MKSLKNILFLAIMALMIVSCGKENIDEKDVIVPDTDVENIESNPLINRGSSSTGDGLLLDCFTITYPFSFIDIDDVTYEVASDEDLEILSLDESLVIVDFVYPLNVVEENGEESQVADGEELSELFASCLPAGGWEEGDFPAYLINYDNSCYNLVYPLSLEKLSGEVVEVENEEDFNATIAEEPAFFVFPIELLHEDGTVVVINNIDEVFEALISCNGFETGDTTGWDWESGFEYIGCYHVEFPLDVVLANGEVVTVNDHMELCDLMLQGEIVSYAYPLTLIDEDGEVVVVNDEDELNELLNECWEGPSGSDLFLELLVLLEGVDENDGGSGCYDISFPIQVELLDGTFEDYNSNQELFDLLFSGREDLCCLVFPFDVTYTSSGDTVTVEDMEDLFQLVTGC